SQRTEHSHGLSSSHRCRSPNRCTRRQCLLALVTQSLAGALQAVAVLECRPQWYKQLSRTRSTILGTRVDRSILRPYHPNLLISPSLLGTVRTSLRPLRTTCLYQSRPSTSTASS